MIQIGLPITYYLYDGCPHFNSHTTHTLAKWEYDNTVHMHRTHISVLYLSLNTHYFTIHGDFSTLSFFFLNHFRYQSSHCIKLCSLWGLNFDLSQLELQPFKPCDERFWVDLRVLYSLFLRLPVLAHLEPHLHVARQLQEQRDKLTSSYVYMEHRFHVAGKLQEQMDKWTCSNAYMEPHLHMAGQLQVDKLTSSGTYGAWRACGWELQGHGQIS